MKSDFGLYLLWRLFRKPLWAYLGALVLNVFILSMGLYYSITLSSQEVVPVWESGQLLQSLSMAIFYSSSIFAFSLWQPHMVDRIVESLEAKKLITHSIKIAGASSSTPTSLGGILESAQNKKQLAYISILIAVISTLSFFRFIIPNEKVALHGRISSYYSRPTILITYVLFQALLFYFLSSFCMHALSIIDGLNKFMSQPGAIIKLSIFDPDKGGGFGVIGNYSLGLGGFAVIMGWVTVLSSIHPLLSGGSVNTFVPVALSIVYICLLPLFLFGPLWSTHKAMLKYRDNLLRELADETDTSMNDFFYGTKKNIPEKGKELEQLKKLSETHDFIIKNMPVWPIGGFAIGRLSIVALGPILINVINFMISKIK